MRRLLVLIALAGLALLAWAPAASAAPAGVTSHPPSTEIARRGSVDAAERARAQLSPEELGEDIIRDYTQDALVDLDPAESDAREEFVSEYSRQRHAEFDRAGARINRMLLLRGVPLAILVGLLVWNRVLKPRLARRA